MDNLVRSLHDIVTMRNPDDEDFVFEYDKTRGNYPYAIKAGEVKRYPRFLYVHAEKHLIDKILTKQKIKTNNEAARAEVRSKIFIEEEIFQQGPADDTTQIINKRVAELNRPSELERVLNRAKANAPASTTPETPVTTAPSKLPSVGDFGETGGEIGEGEAVEDTETVIPPEVKAKPTRAELFKYAESTLNMVLDKETMSKLNKMTVDQLVTEFQYPTD